MVRRRGLEPPHLAVLAPKASASTNSATAARLHCNVPSTGWLQGFDKAGPMVNSSHMKAKVKAASDLAPLTPSWDLIGPSWRILKDHFEQIIILFVLPPMLFILGNLLIGDTQGIHHLHDVTSRQKLGFGVMGLAALWSIFNFAPSLYFRLKTSSAKQVSIAECYRRGLPFFWRLAGLYLFLGIILLIGFLLLIIPGLVLLVLFINRYYLAEYYLMERDLSIKQALLTSHRETAPYAGSNWGIIGVQVVFSLVAGILSSAGRIGAIPAVFIQLICLYLPALRYWEIKHVYHHVKAR